MTKKHRRKLIKQGQDSYTVTLPREWIRKHGLEEESVHIETVGNSLKINPRPTTQKTSCQLEVQGFNERSLRNALYQHYRKGYDRITLSTDNDEQHRIIKDLCERTMLGFDTTSETDHEITVEAIAEPSNDQFSTILRRLFLLIKQEANRIQDSLKQHDIDMVEAQSVKDKVDTYTNYCRRTLRARFAQDDHAKIMLYKIVSRLSLIHHAYYYLYSEAQNHEVISDRTHRLLGEATKLYDDFYTCLYEKDLELAHDIGVRKDTLIYDELHDALSENHAGNGPLLYHVGEIIRLVHMQSTNVFSLPYAASELQSLFTN